MNGANLVCSACLILCSVWAQAAADDKEWLMLLEKTDGAYQKGQYLAACDFAQQALRAARTFPHNDIRRAVTLRHIGTLSGTLGRYAEAEAAYVEAIHILEGNVGQRYQLAQVQHDLARVYMQFGARYAQAEKLMERVLALGIEVVGPDHPDVAGMLANLASARMMLRKDLQAQALLDRALTVLENSPPQYQTEKASILANLGFLSFWRGDATEALSYMERSVTLNETALGPNDPELITGLLNLARLRLELHDVGAAEAPVRQALLIAERSLGPDHPVLYQVLSTYALILRKSGRKADALPLERRAKAVLAANPDQAANLTVHVTGLFDRGKGRGKRLVE